MDNSSLEEGLLGQKRTPSRRWPAHAAIACVDAAVLAAFGGQIAELAAVAVKDMLVTLDLPIARRKWITGRAAYVAAVVLVAHCIVKIDMKGLVARLTVVALCIIQVIWAWSEDEEKDSKESSMELNERGSSQMTTTLRLLKPYVWPQKWWDRFLCLLTFVCIGVCKASKLGAPIYLGKAVKALSSQETEGSKDNAIMWAGIYTALIFVSESADRVQTFMYMAVKRNADVEVGRIAFAHIHSLSYEWHLKKKTGKILRDLERGVEAANTFATYCLLTLAPTVAECVGVFAIFSTHFSSRKLSAIAFVFACVFGMLTIEITSWRKKLRRKTNVEDGDFHSKATDSLLNFEPVKLFGMESHEVNRYTSSMLRYQRYALSKAGSLCALGCSQSLTTAICVFLCLRLVVSTGEDSSTFVAVAAYIANMFEPLRSLGSFYYAVSQAIIDMKNIVNLIMLNPSVRDSKDAMDLLLNKANVAVEFANVSFSYPSLSDLNGGLHNISFRIAPGTTTALCGPSGGFKTTIGRLLFRLYDPDEGAIFIGNVDVRNVTQQSLRAQLGAVPQNPVLFNETLHYNLVYGKPNATEEEIVSACEKAQILDMILALPEKFNTQVGEQGIMLSGGERQRICIARALLRDPPVLLLDEGTSSLDNVVEQSVQKALTELSRSRTTLVIAHRLSTIQEAHEILVVEHGSIVERGTHNQLLSIDGVYSTLWNAPSAGTLNST